MCHPWKLVKYMLIATVRKVEGETGRPEGYMTMFFHQHKNEREI